MVRYTLISERSEMKHCTFIQRAQPGGGG